MSKTKQSISMDETLAFVKNHSVVLAERFSIAEHSRDSVLARTVKLSEEVGELSGEILGSLHLQRKEKLDKFSPENVSKEIADVLITTLLLAQALDVDVPDALAQKIEVIRARAKNR